MKKLSMAILAAATVLFVQSCNSESEEGNSENSEDMSADMNMENTSATMDATMADYQEEPYISEFPLADSALKYSSEGTLNTKLTNRMSEHAEMLSSNLDGLASVIQYGEGVIVAMDQGDVFEKDDFTLNENAKNILRHLAFNLKEMPETYILVAGRADSDGASDHNDKLAFKRAAQAANYLHGCGIEEDRFFVDSYGEKYPDFRNNTGINKNKNRRVDFLIIPSNSLREEVAMNY